ncbi:unnamed protein product (mitochondrion) [Plasmodiophora brassicae]|uniref:Uncharacterized protein n=1 Tax=Plasmodiophora brassicae TaxID=37360 RepID=A0A3P3YM89_PLABS|nr:unnamed protein product [Plasmodiophora brassicae]
MPCCPRMRNKVQDGERMLSRQLDNGMVSEKHGQRNVIKLLLLGTGDSGKSTLLKQLFNIHGVGMPRRDRMEYRLPIFADVVATTVALIKASDRLDPVLDTRMRPASFEAKRFFLQADPTTLQPTPEIGQMIRQVWQDEGVRRAVPHADLHDSATYFMDRCLEITAKDYLPTRQDVIMFRRPSTGITEKEFMWKSSARFKVIDVGGQRNERRKWLHCFEGVTAIIFVVALSEYNQTLYEDARVNRMAESLRLFTEICNSPYLIGIRVILFLNKMDLFQQKIKQYDLRIAFPDYDGEPTFDAGVEFIRRKFEQAYPNVEQEPLRSFVTCSTNADNVAMVFDALTDILLRTSIQCIS